MIAALNEHLPHPSEICVVDDDESVRESLEGLLKSVGFAATVFPSAESFLESEAVQRTRCLILDMRMPGMSGFDLQRELASRPRRIPIIFISAHCDEATRARVLAEGAVDCLRKPFGEGELLSAVSTALATGTGEDQPKQDSQ